MTPFKMSAGRISGYNKNRGMWRFKTNLLPSVTVSGSLTVEDRLQANSLGLKAFLESH